MAQLKKKKSRLGTPPPTTDTLNTLSEPESAPGAKKPVKEVDGRTLKKTGMTEQFNTRVSPEYSKEIREEAKKEGRTLGKMLELTLAAYKNNKR